MKVRHLAKGLLSHVPFALSIMPQKKTGGTDSATYCYEVWMKHLTMLHENGMHSIPHTLAELGPGDSIGIGLAAMLSGVDHYYGLDVIEWSNPEKNADILDQLVEMFRARAPRPSLGWPDYDRYLDEKLFPSQVLTAEILEKSLAPERVSRIRNMLIHAVEGDGELRIVYKVPWFDDSVIEAESVDLVISQSVLEHVDDLDSTYKALAIWLKPEGRMSHQIDFSSHGLSKEWNGYRAYSELLWKTIRGKREFLINRAPCSAHFAFLEQNQFEFLCQLQNRRTDGISRKKMASRWRNLSEADHTCSGAFIQVRKKQDTQETRNDV